MDGKGFVELQLQDVIYREDLYPRIKAEPSVIQRYAEIIDLLPPVEVNQHNILIDGFHRWTAHRKAEAKTIKVIVTETVSDAELYALAIRRNANHGMQLSEDDKKDAAIRLYAAGHGIDKQEIGRTLSVTLRMINNYLHDIDHDLKERRKQKILDLWLACHTQQEIAEAIGAEQPTVSAEKESIISFGSIAKADKTLADFAEPDWKPPIYNVWTFAKKTNTTAHFGNSEQRILDNLLYLYSEPFGIVLDPFAGGGATIDVCKRRLRRYWASDRKPIVEREQEIRQLDIVTDLPPFHKRWSEVTLTYLDPPYWKQAEGEYSQDAEDLANMPLAKFTDALIGVVNRIAEKQSHGFIAMLMQPTQWKADDKQFTDHVADMLNGANKMRLAVENRVSVPYSTEQCNAQMVDWAKDNKKLLVISRELIIWRILT